MWARAREVAVVLADEELRVVHRIQHTSGVQQNRDNIGAGIVNKNRTRIRHRQIELAIALKSPTATERDLLPVPKSVFGPQPC